MSAHLNIFHVYAVPTPVSEIPVPECDVEACERDAWKQMEQLKEKMYDRTDERIVINTEVRPGNLLTELIDYCARVHPYAVVVGAETTGNFKSFLFGAKTISTVKRLEFPVLVVPPTVTFNNIRKIGLACDLRDVVHSVRVKEIKDLVEEFHATLHVLFVSEKTDGGFSPARVEESGMLQEMLDVMKPEYHFINNQQIEQGIIECTDKNKLDLLIVIPKKHDLVHKIFQHSHSKDLVLHSHVPVLSIHE